MGQYRLGGAPTRDGRPFHACDKRLFRVITGQEEASNRRVLQRPQCFTSWFHRIEIMRVMNHPVVPDFLTKRQAKTLSIQENALCDRFSRQRNELFWRK